MEISETIPKDVDLGDNEDLRIAMRAHAANDLTTAELFYRRIEKQHPQSSFVKYLLAHLLFDRRENIKEALTLIRASCDRAPDEVSFLLLQGKVLNELGLWDEAIVSFQKVIDVSPRLPDPYYYLKQPMVASGQTRDYVEILDAAQCRFPDLEVGRYEGFRADQARAIAHDVPSILLVTMPKSGSVYTTLRLSEELGAPQCRISLDLNPVDYIVPSWLDLFVAGGAVCQEHLDASQTNLDALTASGLDRLQIHVRDPRQATLSWVHHIETMVGENAYMRDLMSPALPSNYAELTLPEKIDWNIDNHLPGLVRWTEDWVNAADDNRSGIAMCFSCYEDFHEDEARFFSELLDFFGVRNVAITPIGEGDLANKAVHFRRGEVDEWRRAFSPLQIERASKAIPIALYERFAWSQ